MWSVDFEGRERETRRTCTFFFLRGFANDWFVSTEEGFKKKNPRMAARLDAAALDGMSKKELVVAVQSVAPLELLQANTVTSDLL